MENNRDKSNAHYYRPSTVVLLSKIIFMTYKRKLVAHSWRECDLKYFFVDESYQIYVDEIVI